MHFEGMSALAARHLVLAYVSVAVIQGGYFALVSWNWLKLDRQESGEQKKSAKPVA
jgi:hypothetical protein